MIYIGIIIGLLIAILFFVILSYFRTQIEKKVLQLSKRVEVKNPEVRGGIFLPDDEIDIEREEIIKKNKKAGIDTPFSELRNK